MFTLGNNVEQAARIVVFEAVVRAGGFTAAAQELGVSKASVSKQVARLEEAVGLRLFQRTTRVVRLTDAGRLFHERCAEIVRLMDEAAGMLSSLQHEVRGRLRISVPASFGRAFLEEPLATFIARFPRLEVEVDVTDQQVDVLAEGYDLSIRVGAVTEPDLVTRRLCRSQRLVVAAPGLLVRVGPLGHPRQLTEQACLLYSHQVPRDSWRFRDADGALSVPVRGRIRSGSGELLATLAAKGLGFAWLPDFIVRDHLNSGALVSVLEDHCEQPTWVQAVLPARKFVPASVQQFLLHLQETLGQPS